MRQFLLITLALGLSSWCAACGGGGGGGASSASPPCAVEARTCYVSEQGRDTNSGTDFANALGSVSRAAQIALDNYTIVVAPGTYGGDITPRTTGNAQQGLKFVAQEEKQRKVVIAVGGGKNGFSFAGASGLVIDGFTIIGGTDAGIVLKSSSNDAEIRNCTIFSSHSDGIRVQDSSSVLVFNNLVYRNSGIGVRIAGNISGSPNAQIFNNTIYGNGARGVEIGTSQRASAGASAFNNIIQNNSATLESIKVEDTPNSELGFSGDYNLVFPSRYIPPSIEGRNDIHVDAMFANPNASDPRVADFHLLAGSSAIDGGSVQALPVPIPPEIALADILRSRTTTGIGNSLDALEIDIGYHFLP